MSKFKEFLLKNYKIVIITVFIVILVFALLITGKKRNNNLKEYVPIDYSYFVLYAKNEKVGVVDKKGKVILEPLYYDVYIPNPSKDVFICLENSDEYTFLNSKGQELYTDYEDVKPIQTSESDLDFDKNFFKFQKDGKYGLIDYSGKEIVSNEYDHIQNLENKPGELLVKKDGKYGVLDSSGELKIDIKYDSIVGDEYYTEKYGYGETGYIVSKKGSTGNLYGYLDYSGKQILDVKNEEVSRILKYDDQNVYLIVMNNGKKGVYKNDKEIIEQKYQSINFIDSSDIFLVKRNTNYGFFSLNGKEILPVKYKDYSLAGSYISVTTSNDKKELYDINGNKISNLDYKSIQASGNPDCYIAIDDNGYYSIISKRDTIEDNYTYVSFAFDNYFIFKNEEGYYGLLNIYNGVEIEPEYTFMLAIDGRNAIEADKLDGTVDIFSKDIKKVITMSNAVVENVDENYTVIYSGSEMEYINKDGEKVENTEVFDNEIYAFSENSKWGFKKKNGKILIKAEYDLVTELDEYGFAGILKDGKWGVIDSSGKIIVEPTYEIDTYYLPKFIGKYLLETSERFYCVEPE